MNENNSRIMLGSLKNTFKQYRRRVSWKGGVRYFCISVQKTGTTSVGAFFSHHGFPVATWGVSVSNMWPEYWYSGNHEAIFNSAEFKSYQVFEDTPWWAPDFYKILYHRFPGSKFILVERNSTKWFRSMSRHSGGATVGNTKRHCKYYRREEEFYYKRDNDPAFHPKEYEDDNLLSLDGLDEHYKSIYEVRNREIKDFFVHRDPDKLFVCNLEDQDKWQRLGEFVGVSVPDGFEVHQNRTQTDP